MGSESEEKRERWLAAQCIKERRKAARGGEGKRRGHASQTSEAGRSGAKEKVRQRGV